MKNITILFIAAIIMEISLVTQGHPSPVGGGPPGGSYPPPTQGSYRTLDFSGMAQQPPLGGLSNMIPNRPPGGGASSSMGYPQQVPLGGPMYLPQGAYPPPGGASSSMGYPQQVPSGVPMYQQGPYPPQVPSGVPMMCPDQGRAIPPHYLGKRNWPPGCTFAYVRQPDQCAAATTKRAAKKLFNCLICHHNHHQFCVPVVRFNETIMQWTRFDQDMDAFVNICFVNNSNYHALSQTVTYHPDKMEFTASN